LRNSTILLEKGRTILFYGFGLVIDVLCGPVWMVMILGKFLFIFIFLVFVVLIGLAEMVVGRL
jgi:hypothetical protein